MVCEYFRHGQCTKGFKCKFSHDLALERKTAKADLFQDRWAGGWLGAAAVTGCGRGWGCRRQLPALLWMAVDATLRLEAVFMCGRQFV